MRKCILNDWKVAYYKYASTSRIRTETISLSSLCSIGFFAHSNLCSKLACRLPFDHLLYGWNFIAILAIQNEMQVTSSYKLLLSWLEDEFFSDIIENTLDPSSLTYTFLDINYVHQTFQMHVVGSRFFMKYLRSINNLHYTCLIPLKCLDKFL
jgi:hypothetical protein